MNTERGKPSLPVAYTPLSFLAPGVLQIQVFYPRSVCCLRLYPSAQLYTSVGWFYHIHLDPGGHNCQHERIANLIVISLFQNFRHMFMEVFAYLYKFM